MEKRTFSRKIFLEFKIALIFLIPVLVFINKETAICTETDNITESISIVNNAGAGIFTDKDGIVYKALETPDGIEKCKVISYTGNKKVVVIPAKYNGYTVTSVGDNAFYGNGTVTDITLGSNITTIGNNAFSHCIYLKNINFNNALVKTIPECCFEACGLLQTAKLPASVKKIENKAFSFCDSLYQVIMPGKTKKFEKDIFYGCNKDRLTIVTPPNSKAENFAKENGFLVTDKTESHLLYNNFKNIEGGQDQLYVYNAPSKVKWKSLNKNIVNVNRYGKITAIKPGMATITATITGKKLKCRIKVLKRSKKNCLKVIYSRYVRKEMTDYEKIYAAHAWLIQNVKYDKTLYKKGRVQTISHTAEGAFNKGRAVCDGYSKAFIIIMEHFGIKCKMVTGGTHAWNMVKIKNKWYHIDCTYDDPVVNGSFNNKEIFLDFFLKTDKEMYATHIWDYSAFPKCKSKKIDKNYRTV